eukprot:3042451-Heterocapsa_arctica.AAC.1
MDDHRFIHAFDDEEHYDGDVVLGVDITNKSNKKVMIKVDGTIDSGASNSVAPIDAAPNVPVRESAGSQRGQHYVSAGNERIPNIDEQIIKLKTNEGKKSVL